MRKLIALLLTAVLLTLIFPAAAEYGEDDAEEVFDENEWTMVASMGSVDDVSANVTSALLMEKETGSVLYEHNSHERLAPASVTKVMTMLLICERIDSGLLSLTDKVTVSGYAAQMGGSQIYLEEGEQMTVEELLKSVAVASANDAAVALAEQIAGDEGSFVDMMNARAKELGMNDTVFANCSGLPAEGEHLTSAYDIALMSRELLKHPFIKNYTTIWMDTVRNGEFGINNTNKLVRFYKGTTGLKTGFTEAAMYCLSASAERDGVEYIAVIMHAQTSDIRFECAKLLLNHAFATYTVVNVLPEEAILPVEVTMGKAKYIQPVIGETKKLLLKKNEAAGITRKLDVAATVTAPVAKGQELGTLTVYSPAGEKLITVPVVASEAVDRLSWGDVFSKYLRLLFTGNK
jgi:D-alanyl-D-alanine carboxypeptidase (penicillin-binding protein 5/6)